MHREGNWRSLSPEHRALGRAVREARARRGLSQEELGWRSTLHRNYVGAIERGEINASFRTLLRLTDGLGLSMVALVVLWARQMGHVAPESDPTPEEVTAVTRPSRTVRLVVSGAEPQPRFRAAVTRGRIGPWT